MREGPLEGRVAIVTGASSGIGEAVAKELAGAGAKVVVGARRVPRLEALVEAIGANGGVAVHRRTDVAERGDLDELARLAVERFGQVDILVNNAGVMPLSPVAELRVDDWERMVDVNVKGVLYGIAAVLPGMLEKGAGHIVNVGSVAGRRPFPGGAVYSATKFAVRSLTWGMQLELSAACGIRLTDIQPGVVDTELLEHLPDQDTRRSFEDAWAEKRKLMSKDVAGAVLYAVSAPDHVNVNEILLRPTDQPT
jgi:NADP-dependent 3-hydroxy acid dehydrogenase YdfG